MTERIAPQTHQALACYQTAMSCLAENRLLEAMLEIRRSLDSDPEFYDGQFLKAHLHRLLGQYEEALPILERCLAALSDDVDVLREAAEVTLLVGKERASLRYYQRLHELDPEEEGVCSRIVAVAFQLGGPRLALKKVKLCLREFPEWAPGWLCQGNLLELVGRLKQAEEAYSHALQLAPGHRGARKNLERLYAGRPLEKGQYEYGYEEIFLSETVRLTRDGFSTRSIRMLEKWRPRFRRQPEFLEVLAKTSYELGRYRSALSAIHEIPLDRRSPNVLLLGARSLASLGDYEGAVSVYDLLCKARPKVPEYWLEYLKVLTISEKGGNSAQVVEEAVARLPNDPDLWFEAARIRKRYVGAEACLAALEKVVELRPRDPQALYALGVERLLSGESARAIPALSALTAVNQAHLEGWRHLAIAYTRLKDWRNAHASWSRVLALDPSDTQAAGNLDKLNRLLDSVSGRNDGTKFRRAGSV